MQQNVVLNNVLVLHHPAHRVHEEVDKNAKEGGHNRHKVKLIKLIIIIKQEVVVKIAAIIMNMMPYLHQKHKRRLFI